MSFSTAQHHFHVAGYEAQSNEQVLEAIAQGLYQVAIALDQLDRRVQSIENTIRPRG